MNCKDSFSDCLAAGTLIGAGRVALVVEYNGSGYRGWQIQNEGVASVQKTLTDAVRFVADEAVDLVCAGRTDAGVHASFQVVHFDVKAQRSGRSWILGVNTKLPPDIVVRWAGLVADDFHARFSAMARRYRYVILNTPVRSALQADSVTWVHTPLDAVLMHEAAQCLLGEHDFSSYRAIGCQSKTPVRRVEHLQVSRHGDYIVIDVQANAFLHHMIRNIAGVLIAVGSGKQSRSWPHEVLLARDRTQGGVTALPNGLFFVDVHYPEGAGIPRQDQPGPPFLRAMMPSI